MTRMMIMLSLAVGLLCPGCAEPHARLNAPPHGVAAQTSDLQGTFVYMTDNALLADMTISDVHFLPHRAMLNQLGEQRLCRLASLMEAYGGTIRFNTDNPDENLNQQRVSSVMRFLQDSGVDTRSETIRRDLAGGPGMDADDAILIRLAEGGYKAKGGKPAPGPAAITPPAAPK